MKEGKPHVDETGAKAGGPVNTLAPRMMPVRPIAGYIDTASSSVWALARVLTSVVSYVRL